MCLLTVTPTCPAWGWPPVQPSWSWHRSHVTMTSSRQSSFSSVDSSSMSVSPFSDIFNWISCGCFKLCAVGLVTWAKTSFIYSHLKKPTFSKCINLTKTPDLSLFSVLLQDECYQVRQIFAQKLHLALVKLLLPLEYLAVFALCAKDPVKERRAHARQCLLKNISVRREYIKQNPLAQGQFVPKCDRTPIF